MSSDAYLTTKHRAVRAERTELSKRFLERQDAANKAMSDYKKKNTEESKMEHDIQQIRLRLAYRLFVDFEKVVYETLGLTEAEINKEGAERNGSENIPLSLL